MTVRVPDFIIGGAPRCGTTWLYCLLDRHPEVYMSKPVRPEPKFFLIEELYRKGVDYYSATWFSDIGSARVCGEKSTNYLENVEVSRRIHSYLPHIKLVFILREPAERAFSNYLWSRMNRMESETFAKALELEQQRERDLPIELRYARPHAYLSRGMYADMLRPYFGLFPREQILCLRLEDVKKHPERLAERLHRFLGVTLRPADAISLGLVNPSEKREEQLSPETRRWLIERYAEPNRRLARLLGPDFELWTDS